VRCVLLSILLARSEDETHTPTRSARQRCRGELLTPDEITVLESLCSRARRAADPSPGTLAPGDVVQLRPGADSHWQTSLFLVCAIREDGGISGQILRPHRSGSREAWYTYRPPEVARIGRAPYPEPPPRVRSVGYPEPCPTCHDVRRKPAGRASNLA
jgi:hypothetical protein